MYWVVSITNKQEPLSACLMVIELSFCRDFSLSVFLVENCLSFVLGPYRQCGCEPFRVAVRCLGKLGAVHVYVLVWDVVGLSFWVVIGGDWCQRGRGGCL